MKKTKNKNLSINQHKTNHTLKNQRETKDNTKTKANKATF